ncbi:MAG: hypothetical protein AAF492_33010 [Verrucomicrobiota bacterium]
MNAERSWAEENMSYWGDNRDQLEEYYPTSTSFCRYHSDDSGEFIQRIEKGIIFLMAFRSSQAVKRYTSLCYALEDSVPWDQFEFHVIDVDGLGPANAFSEHEKPGGEGEIFWIRDGKIVDSIGPDWSPEKVDEKTKKLVQGTPADGCEK